MDGRFSTEILESDFFFILSKKDFRPEDFMSNIETEIASGSSNRTGKNCEVSFLSPICMHMFSVNFVHLPWGQTQCAR